MSQPFVGGHKRRSLAPRQCDIAAVVDWMIEFSSELACFWNQIRERSQFDKETREEAERRFHFLYGHIF